MLTGADPARLVLGLAVVTIAGLAPVPPARAVDAIQLASHRAVYDLNLIESRGRRSLSSVQGRIVYDFSGTACEGYALQFRQVTELDNGEGKAVVSDLRSATWEEGAAKAYRFNFQNYLSQRLLDSVDGRAERKPAAVAVSLAKPSDKRFQVDAAVVFPTEHIRRIIIAARAGKPLLEVAVYDGSETGEKLYNTLTVIGQAIPPGERNPTDAAAGQAALANLNRWPVTISYFDKSKQTGEQTPVYSIAFELYDNGVSRALTLDYGDFSISGTMRTLDLRDTKPCQ